PAGTPLRGAVLPGRAGRRDLASRARVALSDAGGHRDREHPRLVGAHAHRAGERPHANAHRPKQPSRSILPLQPELPSRAPPLSVRSLVQRSATPHAPRGGTPGRRGLYLPLVRAVSVGRDPNRRARAGAAVPARVKRAASRRCGGGLGAMSRTFRLLRYVAVMFPPGSHLPQALALFAA